VLQVLFGATVASYVDGAPVIRNSKACAKKLASN